MTPEKTLMALYPAKREEMKLSNEETVSHMAVDK
jgi:hypothetical protein